MAADEYSSVNQRDKRDSMADRIGDLQQSIDKLEKEVRIAENINFYAFYLWFVSVTCLFIQASSLVFLFSHLSRFLFYSLPFFGCFVKKLIFVDSISFLELYVKKSSANILNEFRLWKKIMSGQLHNRQKSSYQSNRK